MILLETPRLRLRAFRDDDAEALAAIYGDPRVTRWICPPMAPERAAHVARHAIAWCQENGALDWPSVWAVERIADGALIGRAGLAGWQDPQRVTRFPRWELGYLVGSQHWSRGYATEAARAVVHHALTALDLPEVVSLVHPDNTPSKRLLDALGFTREDRPVEQVQGQPREVYRLTEDPGPPA